MMRHIGLALSAVLLILAVSGCKGRGKDQKPKIFFLIERCLKFDDHRNV